MPIRLDLFRAMTIMARQQIRRNENMKKRIYLFTAVLCSGMLALPALTSNAQKTGALSKAETIAQQLNLTPEQKIKILPILRDEVPKVNAIKSDNSLSKNQKVQQIRAIHQQTDPQMKAILTPAQYEKLRAIRQQAIRDATQSHSPS
jgi:Spy/CpxP family protein refolding chaperone